MSERNSIRALPVLPQPPEYRHIAKAPGYCVGSDGTVWTCLKPCPFGAEITKTWRLLRPTESDSRRLVVSIYSSDGTKALRQVSRLVLEAFRGPCPSDMECCHNNGRCQDNRLSNLRWDTPQSNSADKVLHQSDARGERNGAAKLTADKVRAIRHEYESGISSVALEKKYGVSDSTILNAVHRRTWRHIA